MAQNCSAVEIERQKMMSVKKNKMAYDNEFRIIANLSTLINGRHTTQLMRVRVAFFPRIFSFVYFMKYEWERRTHRPMPGTDQEDRTVVHAKTNGVNAKRFGLNWIEFQWKVTHTTLMWSRASHTFASNAMDANNAINRIPFRWKTKRNETNDCAHGFT